MAFFKGNIWSPWPFALASRTDGELWILDAFSIPFGPIIFRPLMMLHMYFWVLIEQVMII